MHKRYGVQGIIAVVLGQLYTRRVDRDHVADSGWFPLKFEHTSATIVDAYADYPVVTDDAYA